jgi:RNA polymerase sigma factor (sigma-70 family)
MAVTEASHAASRALDDLYRQYGADVYRYTLAVLGNHADAEDVTQTTFLNAYRALEQGVRPRKPTNWLLTIASNAIKERFRREQARPRVVELDREVATSRDESEGPSVGELLTALSKIPPQQRQAIVLREFEGRSYKEIADILGITTGALETLLFRARRSLTDELAHQLTCTEAQQGISRAADGRLGRKEKRRLQEHVRECPDCAQFARLQQRHSKALRGLALIPIPLSFTLFKGLEGSAAAATLPAAAGGAAGAGAVAAGSTAGGSAAAGGGGLFAGGLLVKAAVLVTAAGVAGGVTVAGVKEVDAGKGKSDARPPASSAHAGKSHTLHSQRAAHVSARGLEHGKAVARGQTGTVPPGFLQRHRNANRGQAHTHVTSAATSHTPKRHSTVKSKPATTPKSKQQPTPNGRATGHAGTSSTSASSSSLSSSTDATTSTAPTVGHGRSAEHANNH